MPSIPCTIMRGGTSRGLYFLASDLPSSRSRRNALVARALGAPDSRQIDGLGGGHPLTSKVAIVGPSSRAGAHVDYLFLQVQPESGLVSDSQNCGNILAGVGQFAIERNLVTARDGLTPVRIHMLNTGSVSEALIQTPNQVVSYEGDARIDGVPGKAAPVMLSFEDTAGSTCGELLPTGSRLDTVGGVALTAIDNGMPVVILRASDLGKTGYESPEELESDEALRKQIETIRLEVAHHMNLGDVSEKTVPKISLISPPRQGGLICTRTFIPHRVHEAIGVLGAVSVATACAIPGSIADGVSSRVAQSGELITVEHPSGSFSVELEVEPGDSLKIRRSALLRTARKLMTGTIYLPHSNNGMHS